MITPMIRYRISVLSLIGNRPHGKIIAFLYQQRICSRSGSPTIQDEIAQ